MFGFGWFGFGCLDLDGLGYVDLDGLTWDVWIWMAWIRMCGFVRVGLGCVDLDSLGWAGVDLDGLGWAVAGLDDVVRCCGVLKCGVCLDDVVQDGVEYGGAFGYHKFC
jgi:hypothetical protein